jgi:hypothetical protein
MIKILGLFGQVQKVYIITRNYTYNYTKQNKSNRNKLLRLITANYTQSKFEKNKKKLFFKNFLSRN